MHTVMRGMTHEQIVTAAVGLLEALIACTLLQAATTPTEVALCGAAALAGMIAFGLALED
jgi:hypothetical protein